MQEVEAPAGVVVGEAVEAEAGEDGGHPRRHHLRLHLLRRLLLLHHAAMSGTRSWSSFCNCANHYTVAFVFLKHS